MAVLSIYDFDNYCGYLEGWIESQSSGGYGVKGKMAKAANISSSLMSQILSRKKNLTSDQASDLCDFMGLNEMESEYFHLLLDHEKAGTIRYKEKLQRKINKIKIESKKLAKRVPRDKELTEQQKSIYYSSWLFTGVRNLSAVPGFQNIESIARHLNLEPKTVAFIVKFLLENGLCLETKEGFTYGPKSTHIDADSPFVNKHHQNWRFRAIDKMEGRNDNDAFFTSPMSLSEEAFLEIRKLIPDVVQKVMKISSPSDSEKVACLNIDWFEY